MRGYGSGGWVRACCVSPGSVRPRTLICITAHGFDQSLSWRAAFESFQEQHIWQVRDPALRPPNGRFSAQKNLHFDIGQSHIKSCANPTIRPTIALMAAVTRAFRLSRSLSIKLRKPCPAVFSFPFSADEITKLKKPTFAIVDVFILMKSFDLKASDSSFPERKPWTFPPFNSIRDSIFGSGA